LIVAGMVGLPFYNAFMEKVEDNGKQVTAENAKIDLLVSKS